jgi:hypothetical protein
MAIGGPEVCLLTFAGGGGIQTFPSTESFPITLTSSRDISVNLSAIDVPTGTWIHFQPSAMVASPNGATSNMTIAGAVQPFTPRETGPNMTIQAAYSGGSVNVTMLLLPSVPIGVIQSASTPMQPHDLYTNENGSSSQTFAVVFDPSASFQSNSIAVTLSAQGMIQNGAVVALPSWLRLPNSNHTLSLTAEQPFYFVMTATGIDARPGTYEIAIQETIGGSQFMVVMNVVVLPPVAG